MPRTEEEQRAWEEAVHDRINKIRRERSEKDGRMFARQWSRWQREEQDAEEERNHPARVLEAQEDRNDG